MSNLKKGFLNKIILIFIILTVSILLTIKTKSDHNFKEDKVSETKIGTIGDEEPITRALVAKMLSLAKTDKAKINSADQKADFLDTDKANWDYKYINYTYQDGLMSGINETEFNPNGNLTLEQTQFLINSYTNKNEIKIKMDKENKDKPITYALWCDIYQKIAKDSDIAYDEVIILLTNENTKELSDHQAITDKGILSFEGLDFSKYANKKIKILRKDTEVLAILEVLEENPTIKSCFISEIRENSIDIFVGGTKKTLYFDEKFKGIINTDSKGSIADIKFEGDRILSIELYKEYIRGNVNLVSDNTIRINNKNYIKDDNAKIYSILDEQIKFKKPEDLIIGQDLAKYFIKENENKIYAAVIDKEPEIKKVRVAITSGDKKSLFFKSLKINADGGFKLYVKGKEKEYGKDYTLEISKGKDFSIGEKEIIKIEPIETQKGINLIGLEKESLNLKGGIEVCKTDDKYLVINEIGIEDYIKNVMLNNPEISKDEEALKALSVIVRTNTINKINENNFYDYGANFDDSASFQLYNSTNENAELDGFASEVLRETKGTIIKTKSGIKNLNYFGYSAGTTGNSGEIWPDKKTKAFPAENKSYLQSKYLFKDKVYENLADEVNANIFFKSKDVDYVENDSPWFRWSGSIDLKEFNKNLTKNLKNLYEQYPDFIKTLQEDMTYKSLEIAENLNIKDIIVKKRGMGGNIIEIEIFTNENQMILRTDAVIKKFFQIPYIINNNGAKIENIKTLPSSYFVFDKIYDQNNNIQKINFYGGGYGHCVGLSIYGAKKMAQNGESYVQILNNFYSEIEISKIN